MSTILEIAKAAKVSPSAVSRIINGKDVAIRISAKTRERVLRVAKELNYQPNLLARGLRSGKSNLIGAVFGPISLGILGEIIQGAEEAAAQHGYGVILNTAVMDERQILSHLDLLEQKRVDGLIIRPPIFQPTGEVCKRLCQLAKKGLPIVAVTGKFENAGIPCVYVDGKSIGIEATRHLLSCGHQNIWHLARTPDVLEGYRQTMEEAERFSEKRVIQLSNNDWQSGYEATKRLLKQDPCPNAIFASSDFAALGTIRALKESGLRTGVDTAVVGVDDLAVSELLETPLTTVSQPKEEQGAKAVEMLFRLMAGENAPSVILQPKLIVRDSAPMKSSRS
ncbi:MAG: LacI family DNA-binding transcriptional regulator [Verrucomicrobiae bacterium]|nr:LacI family DNA-binding transcriptional regulator [Verrucomicrobiae bacterium]